jgi:hypothetical protein
VVTTSNRRRAGGWLAVVGMAACVAGAAAYERPADAARPPKPSQIEENPFDPAGRWVLTLPAGWQRKVTIVRVSDDTYEVKAGPKVLMNGVYELDRDDQTLALLEANDPTQKAFEFQILNANTLQLVRQDTPSGGSYVGATMSRHFEWDELTDNSRAERVGTLSHRPRTAATNVTPGRE